MNSLLNNKKIDLVDFDTIKLLMFKNDNLYNSFVNKEKKNVKIESVYKNETQNNILYDFELSKNPKTVIYFFLNHLIQNGVNFKVFDIGSHVGDFGLKCGNFFKSINSNVETITFDPSPAGQLVDYNIKLNKLEKNVRHENIALSTYDGIHIFKFEEGFSDSAKISLVTKKSFFAKLLLYIKSNLFFLIKSFFRLLFHTLSNKKIEYDLIVEGQKFETYITKNNITSDLFLKIDIEGFDKILISDILEYKQKNKKNISIITELFYDEDSCEYLKMLSKEFYIYDMFYCPNPTRFERIEENNIDSFVNNELSNRKFGYTDIFLLDKNTVNINLLLEKFNQYKRLKDEYKLT